VGNDKSRIALVCRATQEEEEEEEEEENDEYSSIEIMVFFYF
jgi:hypothetical protein